MSDAIQLINVSREGRTGVIELARPSVFNCLSMEVHAAILAALKGFEADTSISALLICAEGKNFCTGAELGEVKEKRRSEAEIDAFLRRGHETLQALEESRLPVVCAVQGLCLAGGMELLLACDVAFAAQTAKFGDQHAQFGLVPGWGASQRLPRLIGLRRAMDLFMSVRWIEAEKAEQWGLVNYVLPEGDLRSEALAYCAKLATRNSVGLAMMKRLAIEGLDMPLADALEFEIRNVNAPLRSDAVTEGLAAFEEKRQPNFG
ncbi:enoyl-CoA hydratase/isomerase family protein [Oryzicola mucosus]|uniref:Enoyl-CoA hydratase/isomerase family protein n=1 Tax=Oryzicola mucosus TaxID=2767425 RepID=A0A8J6PQA9_9HYPH|nr:enoyl-CoA hydratase/isomerase family protein [Oryzicola mucosus]MBD0416722.1 enoyl-CoA hydratase/isomerase family protein [Oryzicola mucosus]